MSNNLGKLDSGYLQDPGWISGAQRATGGQSGTNNAAKSHYCQLPVPPQTTCQFPDLIPIHRHVSVSVFSLRWFGNQTHVALIRATIVHIIVINKPRFTRSHLETTRGIQFLYFPKLWLDLESGDRQLVGDFNLGVDAGDWTVSGQSRTNDQLLSLATDCLNFTSLT